MNIPFVLYPLTKVGIKNYYFKSVLEILLVPNWTKSGVGHSQYFPMTDADDTAVSLYLMEEYGLLKEKSEKYWKAINYYKKDDFYVTYPYEVISSTMVNLHVFDLYNESFQRNKGEELAKLETYFEKIMRNRSKDGLGKDKYQSFAFQLN